MTITATSAQDQWRTRPADECFTSIDAAHANATYIMEHSASKVIPSKALQADVENGKLVVKGPSGKSALPTHWAFSTLCQRVKVPAGYMRDISSPELVADCLNEATARRDVEDISVLLYQSGGPTELHAVNGPNYGRIWNARVWGALRETFGNGVDGDFKNPALFVRGGIRQEAAGVAAGGAKDTTFYNSDRDMWCMLATDADVLQVKNRRDGKTGNLYQGLIVGNSDVGAGKLVVANFLFDDFCYNHLIWGMRELEELNLRHTASAPHRFMSEVVPALRSMAKDRGSLKQAQIEAAQAAKVADIDKFLTNRKYNRSQIAGIKAAFKSDEGVELGTKVDGITSASIWNVVTGLTAYARDLQYVDARVDIQRDAGKMLIAA
jgi:hypothetical protein